jgi:hypothetical protein
MSNRLTLPAIRGIGDNGGPPLEEKPHVPEWGRGGFKTYFPWRTAHRRAWRSTSREIMLRRQAKAEKLGLTYEEYTLEILEHGRYLQTDDREKIAAIKQQRRARGGRKHL